MPDSHPSGFFRALAVDYDGTIAERDVAHPEALRALAELRATGVKVVLVTGRILSELRKVFPAVDDTFDLIVGENGAVVSRARVDRTIVEPVPEQLAAALDAAGVSFQRGLALLACQAADEAVVLSEVRRLGLECELLRNRSALMVLPAGVSKGSGLFEGLGELGISHHNTIAIGDAENDHSLLEVAEVGVTVANAVDALKARADLVLDEADGRGVASFVRGPVLTGVQRVHPRRWRIVLGTDSDGLAVSVPASQTNLLVVGTTQRGKSYVAGLIAERLVRLGYSVLVFDPEGDHTSLGRLRGVLVVGRNASLPSAEDLVRLLSHRFASVVVDLSGAAGEERAEYLRVVLTAVEEERARTGLPHWVIIDEAHGPLGREGTAGAILQPAIMGYCLVTHRPADLCIEALLGVDVLIALPGSQDAEGMVSLVAAAAAVPHAAARSFVRRAGPGHAVVIDRNQPRTCTVLTVAQRETSHLRHWHKYSQGRLPWERRFYFRTDRNTATGRTAGNIEELEHELLTCADAAVSHHSAHKDLSRWIAEVLGDPPLAGRFSEIEDSLCAGEVTAAAARQALTEAIHQRHPE